MESAVVNVRFRLQPCARCQRPTIHALRERAAAFGAGGEFRICASCEPAAFERTTLSLALARDEEAGRHEFLQ